jgi:L-ascorbate metabolism protein UlaG (beta-lactamase superfamily)
MKVTKYGHCCLLIEEKDLRILTDPGSFTTEQDSVKNVDVVLITHEHQDHFHIESLKNILKNNKFAKIITNKGVAKLLDKEKIKYELVEDKQHTKIKNVFIEGFGIEHAEMHSSIPRSGNTGYFINNRLFYPGDAFTNPGKNVEILALPVAGPWMKVGEAIDYALELKPKVCFPVHDGIYAKEMRGFAGRMAAGILEHKRIEFVQMNDGDTKEF